MKLAYDPSSLQKRLAGMQRELGEKASKAASKVLVEAFRDRIASTSPKDTNRYLRGWMMACSAAGVPSPLPTIQASSRQSEYIAALEKQRDWWAARVQELTARKQLWFDGRENLKKKTYFNKLTRQIARAEKRLEAAEKQLGAAIVADDGFLVMDGGFAALRGQWSAFSRAGGKNAIKKRTTTIRWKVYGGTARTRNSKGQTSVVLTNLEPHSAILESKAQYAHRAMVVTRSGGSVRAGKVVLERLKPFGVKVG